MSSFSLQLLWEFRLQRRYYFWTTAAVLTAVWVILLFSLNDAVKQRWLPILVFADLSNIGLLFVAGILYLERRQGTLYALVVTPVPKSRWLLLKLISLGLLTTVCALVIVFLSGTPAQWIYLIPAVVVTAMLFTLCGFLLAAPFERIMNYFLGMALTTTVLSLPVLDYFEIYPHWIYWLLPTHPVLLVLAGSFEDMETGLFITCLLVSGLWVLALFVFSQRQFHRYVTLRPQG